MEIISNPRLQVCEVERPFYPYSSNKATTTDLVLMLAVPCYQELMRAVMEKDEEKMQTFGTDKEIIDLLAKFRRLAGDAGIDPSTFSSMM